MNKSQTWCGILLGAYTGIFPSEWGRGAVFFSMWLLDMHPYVGAWNPLKIMDFNDTGWAEPQCPHPVYTSETDPIIRIPWIQKTSVNKRKVRKEFMNYSSMFSFYTISISKIFFYQGRFRQKQYSLFYFFFFFFFLDYIKNRSYAVSLSF